MADEERVATNITWHEGHVARVDRHRLLGQKGATIWMTGLPSAGKSTLAFTLEHALVRAGRLAYVLDGDNIRHGLNKNLGFSEADRRENIRRIAEVAKLFADAGVITITSFISPYRRDRALARDLHTADGLTFIEVFVNAPLEVCEGRDPKGLYRRARAGEIRHFTGIDDPYEEPENPEIVINSAEMSPEQGAATILAYLEKEGILKSE